MVETLLYFVDKNVQCISLTLLSLQWLCVSTKHGTSIYQLLIFELNSLKECAYDPMSKPIVFWNINLVCEYSLYAIVSPKELLMSLFL